MSQAIYQERVYWFHRRVKDGRYPNARHLAEHFEISHRSAKRLITFMRDRFHAPLEYDAQHKGYIYDDSAFELPRIPVTQEELLAVLLARRLLSRTAGGFIGDAIRRFGDKLMEETSILEFDESRLEDAFSASWHGHSPVSADKFQSVCSALLEHRLLDIVYQSPAADPSIRRFVEPHHLRYYMGSWVLIARCRLREAWRSFYLSRMLSFHVTEEVFQPQPVESWRDYAESAYGIFQNDSHTIITLRFTPFRSRWIREQVWHDRQRIEEMPDGGVRLSFPVADFREVKMMILSFGADVMVETPEELREEVLEEIGRMSGVYDNTL